MYNLKNDNITDLPIYPSLAGKAVLITGGRSGIGWETASAFSRQGAQVTIIQRTPFYCHDTNINSIQCDISNMQELQNFIDNLKAKNIKIDILINNAAANYNATLSDIDMERWAALNRINVSAPLYLTSQLCGDMINARWGRIINISSISIYDNTPFNMLYAATKSALSSLTRSWAKELAKYNITVNSITPGFCETEFTHQIQAMSNENNITPLQQYESTFKTFVPTRRATAPADIAAAILFLCSNQSGNITGESINICGGQFMMN